jgi:WD40 repeat protein
LSNSQYLKKKRKKKMNDDSSSLVFDRAAHATQLAKATQESLSVVYDVAFSSNGQHCVASTSQGELHWFDLDPLMRESYWDSRVDHCVKATRRIDFFNKKRIFSVKFFNGDDAILSGGDDGAVRAWSVKNSNDSDGDSNGKMKFEILVPARQFGGLLPEINALVVDRGRIFGAAGNGIVYEWDAESQQLIQSFNGHQGQCVHALALAPPTGALFSAAEDGNVRMWDSRSGADVTTLTLPRATGSIARAMRAVAVSADGHWLAAGGGANAAGLWHTPSQQLVSVLPHAAAVGALRFVPGGLVSGDVGGSALTHWNVDGSFRMRVATHATAVYAIAHNTPTQYEMLACAGMSTSIDVFFGNFAKRAFSLSVV